ncbi:hypothetical protein C8R44DRAFT_933112 [Mycena epipterygia]|nr:hypothetical protein C8R44DRAFT_933112 [Mycena epipterygia]
MATTLFGALTRRSGSGDTGRVDPSANYSTAWSAYLRRRGCEGMQRDLRRASTTLQLQVHWFKLQNLKFNSNFNEHGRVRPNERTRVPSGNLGPEIISTRVPSSAQKATRQTVPVMQTVARVIYAYIHPQSPTFLVPMIPAASHLLVISTSWNIESNFACNLAMRVIRERKQHTAVNFRKTTTSLKVGNLKPPAPLAHQSVPDQNNSIRVWNFNTFSLQLEHGHPRSSINLNRVQCHAGLRMKVLVQADCQNLFACQDMTRENASPDLKAHTARQKTLRDLKSPPGPSVRHMARRVRT